MSTKKNLDAYFVEGGEKENLQISLVNSVS